MKKNNLMYSTFQELYDDICNLKEFVVKLNSKQLKSFKSEFYGLKFFNNINFNESMLDRIWEVIWGDITVEEVEHIFLNNKIIERRCRDEIKRESIKRF